MVNNTKNEISMTRSYMAKLLGLTESEWVSYAHWDNAGRSDAERREYIRRVREERGQSTPVGSGCSLNSLGTDIRDIISHEIW